MQCEICGKHLRVTFKELRIDTLYKEYECRNHHKTIYRRYGNTVEINGKPIQINESFDVAEATRSEARERRIRDLLPETTHKQTN